MKQRQDLLDPRSPAGLEVIQLTTGDIPSCHVYMEAQVCTPDSRLVVLHRGATPHGPRPQDPEHRYLLADLAGGMDQTLVPLTDELGTTAPSLSPDGRHLYYFVDETRLNAGRLTLKRVGLDGSGRETVCVLDTVLPGAKGRINRVYPLSTISSDGRRIAASGFIGDGRSNFAAWGLVVFDINEGTAELVLSGPTWCNMHPQYCRSTDPVASHDILLQENHGNVHTPDGQTTKGCSGRHDGGLGVDIHVIRDDGADFRNLPWGRDAHEYCQGHQCWRGRSTTAIATAGLLDRKIPPTVAPGFRPVMPVATTPGNAPIPARGLAATPGTAPVKSQIPNPKSQTLPPPADPPSHEEWVLEGQPAPYDGHLGLATPGGRRNVLSRQIDHPRFFHFATDIAGQRFITDANPHPQRGCELYLAGLGRPLEDPLLNLTYLLDTGTHFWKSQHPHPFLTLDGRVGFFNSDESGVLQAYMIRGLPD